MAQRRSFYRSDRLTPVAAFISDVHMPGLSGIDVKRRLDESGDTAPVILITGRSESRLLAEAAASGAICVLRKPFDADALLAGLRQAKVV
jgi:FixJ family two-component response regulator